MRTVFDRPLRSVPMIRLFMIAIAISIADTAFGTITVFIDPADWTDAAGPGTAFIDFTDLDESVEIVTDEYAGLGVLFAQFPESSDVRPVESPLFVDGKGVRGVGPPEMLIHFTAPRQAIGFQTIAGFDRLDFLDSEGSVVGDVNVRGEFRGFVTDFEFHSVRLLITAGNFVQLDDLYVGPPIPAPAGLGLLALAGAVSRRRPRS